MPSHVTTPSPNSDSSFQENQPLERRERVRSSIQMNIEEISTISVQAEDIPEDVPAIEHPANEITREAAGGYCSSLTKGLAPLQQRVLRGQLPLRSL